MIFRPKRILQGPCHIQTPDTLLRSSLRKEIESDLCHFPPYETLTCSMAAAHAVKIKDLKKQNNDEVISVQEKG